MDIVVPGSSRKRKATQRQRIALDSIIVDHRSGRTLTPVSSSSNMQVVRLPKTVGHRRPVDKSLINVKKDAVTSTKVTTTLVTATFPCTIVGLRWDLSFIADGGTSITSARWAIVVNRDGQTTTSISDTDGANFYDPEQNVLTFGNCFLAPGDGNQNPVRYLGDTKTMRKLMGGDELVFIMAGEDTNTSGVRGTVQFFCKT